MAQALHVQQRATETYDNARISVRSALHLDWSPESLTERSAGEVSCWQRRDSSTDNALLTDYQGNVYLQDAETSQLRVLKLRPGFSLERRARGDWMSESLADEAQPTGSLH